LTYWQDPRLIIGEDCFGI